MKRVDILLAAEDSCVRLGLRTLLDPRTTKVIAEAAGALDAIAKASTLQPGIVVLDLGYPYGNGLATLREIAHAAKSARIILLSDQDEEMVVEQALMHGASAYLLKQTATTDLGWAVAAVQKGREFFSPTLIQQLRPPRATVPEPDQREGLAPAESRLMEARLTAMIHQGMVIRQMAQELRAGIQAVRQSRAGAPVRRRPHAQRPTGARGWGIRLLAAVKRQILPATGVAT